MEKQFFVGTGKERPLGHVPTPVSGVLLVALFCQVFWHLRDPLAIPAAKTLPAPPAVETLELLSIGDSLPLARLLMLWLQAFDCQPGVSIPFRDLDYVRLAVWLERILQLDPRSQYPLVAASRLYSEVPDIARKRLMLDLVHDQFFLDPNRRWPSLAHAVYIVKHRLEDLPLALRYARSLADNVSYEKAPFWVRQMEIYVLEDMGEIERAKVLIGGLLESGDIKDAQEVMFLQERLRRLEEGKLH